MPLDLNTPRDALDASIAVRERYRRSPADDSELVEALTAALGRLRDAWTPEHERYCRSGRQLGRTCSDDPMRVLARERRAELARLRSALARTSGTPRDERAPENGGPLPPIGYQQIRGHIRRLLSVVKALEDQHTTLVRVLGRGDGYAGMSTLRAEAAVMLDDLREARQRVRVAWDRYERRTVVRDPRKPYADEDQYESMADLLALARLRADALTIKLRKSATTTRPLTVARRQWTEQTARGALHGFEVAHGRKPRKADCRPENGLPHYTQLRRLLGPSPLV